MANKYNDDEIITLDYEDGDSIDCGMMGIFEVDGKDYIALEALDGSEEVYLYGYREREGEGEFDLLDIESEELFERVAAEFESLMDEPL